MILTQHAYCGTQAATMRTQNEEPPLDMRTKTPTTRDDSLCKLNSGLQR